MIRLLSGRIQLLERLRFELNKVIVKVAHLHQLLEHTQK